MAADISGPAHRYKGTVVAGGSSVRNQHHRQVRA